MQIIREIKTASNVIYIYKKNSKLFAFKPTKKLENEILANKLAKLFDVKTLKIKQAEINDKKGILMDYLNDSVLLMYCKKELNKQQLEQLKRIILFDIWIGNKDRHSANILVNDDLIAFDHERVFQKGTARSFIKLDTGRKLAKNYVDIIERLIGKDLTAKQVLKKLGFTENDFIMIKDMDIKKIVKNKDKLNYLMSRRDFSRIKF